MVTAQPAVVVLGGGTGTFTVLSGLKHHPVWLTAILTMVDDGGSNKVLRDQFGLLPTSGIRQAIVALSENDTLLRELFTYRFHQGDGLKGMTFGNLFMAAMADITGSQQAGIQETMKLLNVRGDILPVSYDDVRLVAQYEDGSVVVGEHHIDEPAPEHNGMQRIRKLWTDPPAKLHEQARQAIAEAQMIILGPGDFYTNTVANFVVQGLPEALQASPAKKVFVTNLMTKYGETPNYTLHDFADEIDRYYGMDGLDVMVINNNLDFPPDALVLYEQQHSRPVQDDLPADRLGRTKLLRADLLSQALVEKQQGDVLHRSILRHDAEKLAAVLMDILNA